MIEYSGVAKVGVTRGGNWWSHPYFSSKNWQPFLAIALFLAVVSSPFSFSGVYRNVLSKFSHKK